MADDYNCISSLASKYFAIIFNNVLVLKELISRELIKRVICIKGSCRFGSLNGCEPNYSNFDTWLKLEQFNVLLFW